MQIVGKLTAKSLGWDRFAIGNATKDTTQRQHMGLIAGVVSGLRQTVNNETGDIQTGLKGNFRGISTVDEMRPAKNKDGTDKVKDGKAVMEPTGEKLIVTSGVCYLPGGIQDMIEGTLAKAKEADPKATVSFALDLYCVKDTNKAGYTFQAETKLEAAERDPLDILIEQARGPAALTDQSASEDAQDTADAAGGVPPVEEKVVVA